MVQESNMEYSVLTRIVAIGGACIIYLVANSGCS